MGWSRVQSQHDVERRRRRHYRVYDDHVVEQPVVEVPMVDLSEHVVTVDRIGFIDDEREIRECDLEVKNRGLVDQR